MTQVLDQTAIQAVSRGLGCWPSGIAATDDGFWFTARYPGRVYRYTNGVLEGSTALDRDVTLEAVSLNGPSVLMADADRGIIWLYLRGQDPIALNASQTQVGNDAVPDSSEDGTPTKTAKLNLPLGVAAGLGRAIVVSEGGSGRVRGIDPSGTIQTLADGLNIPSGVAVGKDNTVAIAESGGGRVLRWDSVNKLQTVATDIPAPDGIAVDDHGTIWVTDGRPNELLGLRKDGTQLRLGLTGVAQPGAISLGKQLLVIDRATATIWQGALPGEP